MLCHRRRSQAMAAGSLQHCLHGPRLLRTAVFWTTCCLLLVTRASSQDIDWPNPAAWQGDAELTDIHFIDTSRGWAVGDRGTLLRTRNGGDEWDQVALPSPLRFEAIHFFDQTTGWIVGGYEIPEASSSRGVILKTVDAGQTWQPIRGLTLPRLNQVWFETATRGWAVGQSSARYPSGLFQTDDGGITWSSIPHKGPLEHWQTGHRRDGQWVIASPHGRAARYENGKFESTFFPESGPVGIYQLKMLDQDRGVAVADGGNFLSTRNGGLSWHPARGDAIFPGAEWVDFRTMFQFGGQTWIAGAPGTSIARLDSETGRWHVSQTPLTSAINRIFFIDSQTGWAIGNDGAVIRTKDAGHTWQIQRQGFQRLAMLQIVGDPSQISAEAFAQVCGEENLYGAALILRVRDDAIDVSAHTAQAKARQACARLGASFVDFCLLDADTSSKASHEMVVRRLRMYRPSVVVLPPDGTSPRDAALRSLVIEAINKADDETAFDEQFSSLGLLPWQVRRVALHSHGSGDYSISHHQFLPAIGCLVGDWVVPSRLLLGQRAVEDRSTSFQTIQSTASAASSDQLVPPDSAVARPQRSRGSGNLALMQSLARKRRTLDRLVDASPNVDRRAEWKRNLMAEISNLDEASAGVWLYQLADRYDERGAGELAAETYSYLARALSDHPLSVAALRWLYRHYASQEKARIHQRQLRRQKTPNTASLNPAGVTRPVTTVKDGVVITEWKPVETDNTNTPTTDPRQATQASVIPTGWNDARLAELPRRRFQQAKIMAQSLGLQDFGSLQSGRCLLTQIQLNRKLDPVLSGENQFKSVATQTTFPLVAAAARRELQLDNRIPGEIGHLRVCQSADRPPRLDGRLDETFWQQNPVDSGIGLKPIQTAPGQTVSHDAQVRMACDQSYLYLAIQCRKRAGFAYQSTDSPRQRDANLTERDRLEIALDTDRDFTTYFLFSIDSAGRVADSCGGNLGWNPNWYVASRQDEHNWYAEVAVELDEITAQPCERHWCVSISRFIRQRPQSTWPPAAPVQPAPAARKSAHAMAVQRDLDMYRMAIDSFGYLRMPASIAAVAKLESEAGESAEPAPADQKQENLH